MASLRQIHSNLCFTASSAGCAGEGDALVTAEPGLAVSVRTADCLPVLLADTRHRAVAAIHAGWRGSASAIVVAALRRMQNEFGTAPGDVFAAIGPGIGVCCYFVGEDVARKFGHDRAGCIDLAGANRAQLVDAGVPAAHIDVLGLCTQCDPARFHSFRRDKEAAGRMISFIRVAEKTPV